MKRLSFKAPQRRKGWTADEEALFDQYDDRKVAEITGRPFHTVRGYRVTNLRRKLRDGRRPWTPDEDRVLDEHSDDREASQILNRPPTAVAARRQRLKRK